MSIELRPGERLDDLQTGGMRLIQRKGSFCFGTDTVLLADFASPKRRERVVDLGTGNGAIALLLAGHCAQLCVDAVEIQAELSDMAQRSVMLNALSERVRIFNMDMRTAWQSLGREQYTLAVCNPPYGAAGCTLPNRDEAQRIARHEDTLTPEAVAASAASLLRYGGRFCTIYPAPRMLEMMSAMQGAKLAPKRVRSIHASAKHAPKLVLMEAIKGGGTGLHWLPPLILKDESGAYSAEWRRIYGL